jgi:hypothetical protein
LAQLEDVVSLEAVVEDMLDGKVSAPTAGGTYDRE